MKVDTAGIYNDEGLSPEDNVNISVEMDGFHYCTDDYDCFKSMIQEIVNYALKHGNTWKGGKR